MAMQESTLPRRVARSAKDLTLAAVSGTGAASELQDPRAGKQSGSSTNVSQNCTGQQSGLQSRPRTRLGSPESSFRSQASASASAAAEEDFDLFQEHEDFSDAWQLQDIVTQLTDSSDAELLSERLHEHPDEIFTTHNHAGERHSESIEDTETNIGSSDLTTNLSSRSLDLESNATDFARKAAFRRLDQIGAHLQRNIALQTLRQDVDMQAHNLHDMVAHTRSEQHHHHHHHHHTYAEHHREPAHVTESKSANNLTQMIQVERKFHYPLPPTNERQEKQKPQYQFDCPYNECHRILNRLEPSSLRSDSKPCVHDGCWFHAEGMDAWLEHIKLPHHDDLQGAEQ